MRDSINIVSSELTELKITKSVFGGEGLAIHQGKVCFVPGAFEGEMVEAKIVQEKKNFFRAKMLRVVQASPHRVKPPCLHYSFCGGCQYQHVSYEEERRLKGLQVGEILQRLAGVKVPVQPMLYSEKEYGYRNSVTFHLTQNPKTNRPVFNFIANDNVSTVAIKRCDILDDRFKPILKVLPHFNKQTLKDCVGGSKISFKISENGEIVSDEEERFFRIHLNGESILVHSKGFFQTNLRVTELLANKVKEWMDKLNPQIFFDLFSGVGTFSWLCAKHVPKIFCIEENPFSLSALQMNKEEKKVDGLEIHPGRVEKVFPLLGSSVAAKNAVVLMDPPRQGLDRGFAQKIAQAEGVKALIYISCDIPTLARDLKIILSSGRFILNELVPLDMFPRTKHIEGAVLLTVR
jgi:tRNA/tmRNA/rRNA uracil-C5-methylase (TrmA/RlmC/RlmD family)